MGLDISINAAFYEKTILKPQTLSRSFLKLLSGRHLYPGKSEMEQIGRLFKIDLQPVFDMEYHMDANRYQVELSLISGVEERQKLEENRIKGIELVNNNLSIIQMIISQLLDQLKSVNDLPANLIPNIPEDVHWYSDYLLLVDGQCQLIVDLESALNFINKAASLKASSVYWNIA